MSPHSTAPTISESQDAPHSRRRRVRPHGELESHKRRHVDEYSQIMRSLAPSSNPLQAFAAKPVFTVFASQEQEEQLVLLLRRHPITQVGWIVIAVVAALIPVFFDPGLLSIFLPAGHTIAVIFAWYAAVIAFIFQSFLGWYYNVYIITDERVVDVDFISLLYRNITSAKLDNIEDVTATSGGAFATVFDYGTVHVQTAGAKREIEFEDVPHPNMIVQLFNELLLEEEQEKIEGRVS